MKIFALAILAVLAVSSLAFTVEDDCSDSFVISAGETQSDPYEFSLLVGDQYRYVLSANIAVIYSITAGNLNNIGFSLSDGNISGTAKEGKELICITATSNDGGPVRSAGQWINYSVYNILNLAGTPQTTSWSGTPYSSSFTISDVDPDSEGETVLSLNDAAVSAGYAINKVSETSYTLTRSADKNVTGSVDVIVTASTSIGGITQTKTASATISTYSRVGITSMPENHQGTGLVVWLIEDNSTWEYRPTAVPDDASITVSGVNSQITWNSSVLTVNRSNAFDSTKVTFTATSSAGGSEETATQEITIRNWNRVIFESAPSLSDIVTSVDGRSIHASVNAANYNYIKWMLSDGTVYEGTTEIDHTFAEGTEGPQDVRVLVRDEVGREKASQVTFNLEDNSKATSNTNSSNIWLVFIILGAILIILGLFNKPHWLLSVIGAALVILDTLFFRGGF